ncbi:hypothetical protein AB0939_18560 [Streptomyces sp. NPDC006990]|uniref:hypothetical protein n=1 Tax=unclassified Streptomyces TaxID=2593676 RepID=UPI003455F9B5
MQLAVDGTVVVSVLLSLALATRLPLAATARWLPGPRAEPPADPSAGPPHGVGARRGRRRSAPGASPSRRVPGPLGLLGLLVGAVLVNQIAVVVYIRRVHGGDPGFVARYLPPGWFELPAADWPPTRLAAHWPWPEALAGSVLRVQAALELPLVLLAFAVVLRWLDDRLYRRVFTSPLLVVAALAYTAVFCAVEWDLRNPWTTDDLLIRCASALVTPPLLAAAVRHGATSRTPPAGLPRPRPLSAGRLLLFLGSLASFGGLVLLAYDTLLLYNLGRLEARLPFVAGCALVLAGCRAADRRLRTGPDAGPAVAFLGHALRRFLLLFFAPALAVRYGVVFGTPALAAGAGLLLGAVAAALALRDTLTAESAGTAGVANPGRLLLRLAVAAVAGTAAGWGAARVMSGGYYETALLAAGAAFLAVAVGVCVLGDARDARRPPVRVKV